MIFLQVILPFRCWDAREISYTAVPSSKIKMLEEMSWSFVDQLYAQLGWCSSNNLHSLFHIAKTLFWTCIHLSKLQSNNRYTFAIDFVSFLFFLELKKILSYVSTDVSYIRAWIMWVALVKIFFQEYHIFYVAPMIHAAGHIFYTGDLTCVSFFTYVLCRSMLLESVTFYW